MTNKVVFNNYGAQENWINGKYQSAKSEKTISVISPYFDQEIATIPESIFADFDNEVKNAQSVLPSWSGLTIRDIPVVIFILKSILHNNLY